MPFGEGYGALFVVYEFENVRIVTEWWRVGESPIDARRVNFGSGYSVVRS